MSNIAEVFGLESRRLTKGEVGIEVEVEGRQLPILHKLWTTTSDGSLQGESAEYVLTKPSSKKDAFLALDYLQDSYKEAGTKVVNSVRCGVHVHVNVQEMSILQLYNFMCLYLIFEGLLVKWCGPSREGNLFCLRAYDAEWLVHELKAAARDRRFSDHFYSDDLRYASMNVKAVREHGSLEFRSMRGVEDLSLIKTWVDMILCVRDASLTFSTPIDVITGFSGCDYPTFAGKVFKDYMKELYVDGADLIMIKGMRQAQDVAYALSDGDWLKLRDLTSNNPFKFGGIGGGLGLGLGVEDVAMLRGYLNEAAAPRPAAPLLNIVQ